MCMTIDRVMWTFALSATLLGGCFAAEDETLDDTAQIEDEIIAPNGLSLNGISLNGRSLNGVSLNGVSLNGRSLNGVSLNGTQLQGTKDGAPVNGASIVGSLWNATLSDGSAVQLRFDTAGPLAAPSADVWAYGVSMKSGSTWVPLCGSAAIKAVPVVGTFNNGVNVVGGGSYTYDATKLTLACRGAAIAKCVELGYKPWKKGHAGVNLRNHMVACTRMLRGDYCGDGRSFTVDGNQVNLYDLVGVQSDTNTWRMDAEWTVNGARCVRQSAPPRLATTAPSCYTSKVHALCGLVTDFALGALVMNEVP